MIMIMLLEYMRYIRYTTLLHCFSDWYTCHILSNPTGSSAESIRRAAVPVQAALYRWNLTVQTCPNRPGTKPGWWLSQQPSRIGPSVGIHIKSITFEQEWHQHAPTTNQIMSGLSCFLFYLHSFRLLPAKKKYHHLADLKHAQTTNQPTQSTNQLKILEGFRWQRQLDPTSSQLHESLGLRRIGVTGAPLFGVARLARRWR